jgi:hypothetical protein
MIWFEWPKINPGRTKEKAVFLGFTGLGVAISLLLIFFPGLPGPTELMDMLFRPLADFFGLNGGVGTPW